MGKGKQGWRAESRNKSGVVGKDRGGSGESQLAVLATAGRAATLGQGGVAVSPTMQHEAELVAQVSVAALAISPTLVTPLPRGP